MALPAGGAAVPLPLGPAAVSAAGTQLEVQLNVSCAPPDAAALGCAAGVLLTTSPAGALGPRTAVLLTLPGLQTTREARLTVDRSATGGPGDARPQSAAWPAAAAGAGLTLYVDHSVLEAVAGDGFAAVTSRIYPDAAAPGAGGGDRAAWGLALVATRGSATVSARVWALGGAFVDEL